MTDQSSGGLSSALLRRVDAACDRFEAALRAGEQPSIDSYLQGLDGPESSVLGRELRALARAYAPREPGAPHTMVGSLPTAGSADADGPSVVLNMPRPAGAGPPAPVVPVRFGDYELLDKLGQGGMGEVFRARQVSANRIVVLKIIRRDRLEDLPEDKRRAWEERFGIEARTAAQMEHENIVPVYQVGAIDGLHYYSMRFIAGRNLGELLQQGPLPPARAAAIMEKVARAVHHAHERGILHRDVKPRNIIIDATDRPFVTDFGLAKWLLGDSAELTGLGALVGSPPYIAPEQISDPSAVTTAADVYSLGATLYHLLTGRPPFLASSIHETLRQAQEDEPVRPTRLEPRLNRDLDTICLKCLQKDPRRRYATALDLADDLRRYLNREPIRARRTAAWERGLKWAKRHPAAGLLYVFLVLASAGLLWGLWSFEQANVELLEANTKVKETNDDLKHTNADLEKSKRDLERINAQLKERGEAVEKRDLLMQESAEGIVKRLEEGKRPYPSEERRAFLLDLADVYEKLCQVKKHNLGIQRETARAYRMLGKVRELLGEVAKAEQAFASAVAHLKPFDGPAADEPTRHELADNYQHLGVVRMNLGKVREAEAALLTACAMRTVLAESGKPRLRCELATSYYFLGRLRVHLEGRRPEGAANFHKARAIQEQLKKEYPKDPDFRRDLAQTIDQQAMLAWKTGKLDKAGTDFREAEKILEELAQTHGEPVYQLELARVHMDHGEFLGAGKQREKAQACYEDAIERLDGLCEQATNVPDYRLELAAAHLGLAVVLTPRDEEKDVGPLTKKIVLHLEEGYKLLEKLDADGHDGTAYERRLAAVRSDLGFGWTQRGHWLDADAALGKAIAQQRVLAKREPRIPDDADALGKSLTRLARLSLTQAYPILDQGTNNWLLNLTSGNPWLVARAVMRNAAFLHRARNAAEQACGIHRQLITQDTPNPLYREHLRDDYATLAEIALTQRDHASAAAAATRMPDALTEPAAVAQEHVLAAEVLVFCIRLARRDATLTAAERQACAEDYAQRAVAHLGTARIRWSGTRPAAFRVLWGRKDFDDLLHHIKPASR